MQRSFPANFMSGILHSAGQDLALELDNLECDGLKFIVFNLQPFVLLNDDVTLDTFIGLSHVSLGKMGT